MERKEAIKLLSDNRVTIQIISDFADKEYCGEALNIAISALELLEERASGGVEKSKPEDHICDKEWQSRTNPEPCIACIKDNIIDLCNAHWAEKMKGIPLFLAKGKEVKEPSDEYIKGWNDYRQALTDHLTGGIKR